MPRRPRLDPEQIRAHVEMLSREPFQELLADVLECAPSREALRRFAEKTPDRYGQLLAIAGRLSGFAERQEVDHRHLHLHAIASMSDAELLEEVRRADAVLAAAGMLEYETNSEVESGGTAVTCEENHKG